MAQKQNDLFYKIDNVKTTIPAYSAQTGTVTTDGIYVGGTGTTFTTELKRGDWIVSLSGDEVRQIDSVTSDIIAQLTHPFTVELSGSALNVIKKFDLNIKEISVVIPLKDSAGTE